MASRGSPFKMTNFDQFWMKASSQRLQALCARQRFSEAVPLFRRTLEILQAQPRAMRKPETKPGTKAVNWICLVILIAILYVYHIV